MRYKPNGKPELSLRLSVPNGERDGKRFFLPVDVTVYGQACEGLAEALERDDLVELTGQTTWPKPSKVVPLFSFETGHVSSPRVAHFSLDQSTQYPALDAVTLRPGQ